MAVSPLPILFPLFLLLLPFVVSYCFHAAKKKPLWGFAVGFAASLLLLFVTVGLTLLRGAALRAQALEGEADAQFEYARWLENHPARIGQLVYWPDGPDIEGGYEWLSKAAANGHSEANYALGVRFKHGLFVPPGWTSSSPDVAKGQKLIDKGLRLGYRPTIAEELYYFKVYRRW